MGKWPQAGLGEMYRLIDSLPDQLDQSAELAGLAEIQPAGARTRRLVFGQGSAAPWWWSPVTRARVDQSFDRFPIANNPSARFETRQTALEREGACGWRLRLEQ